MNEPLAAEVGSRPVIDPSVAEAQARSALASADPVAALGSEIIGGPPGRYARLRTARWTPLGRDFAVLPWQPIAAVLSTLASVMIALGVAQKHTCFATGWAVPGAFWRACYVDMPYVFANTQLATGGMPYPTSGGTPLAQPVGTGLALWLTALLVPGNADPARRQALYVGIWAVVIAISVIVTVCATAATTRRHPWRAAHVALSPLLVTVALVSPDLPGVALTSLGVLLWARRHPLSAGIVLGLAVATRTYPLLVVAAVGLVALRSGALRAWFATAGASLLTWVAVIMAVGVPSRFTDLRPYQAWWNAGADYGSLAFLAKVFDRELPVSVVTALVVLSWGVALLSGAALALMAPRRPAIAEVALVIVAIALVFGKSFPVQSSLWLLPLAALAGVRWRDHLIWAACEVAYFVAVWLYVGGLSDPNKGLPIGWYAFFIGVRFLGIAYLVFVVSRRALSRPGLPAQAWDGREPWEHDDLAGPAWGAKDALIVRVAGR